MALLFRSYHAFIRQPLHTKQGFPTAALYGSALFILKLIEEEKPDYLVVASDSKQPTFRHELYPDYKAHRVEMPEELLLQLPHFYEMIGCFQIPLLIQPGVEADDLIASLTHHFTSEAVHSYIVSGDKDFMQLINDQVFLYTPKKGNQHVIIDRSGVFEKFGCFPEQVIDILALCGDASDNVPGVRGIGEKGAAKLILEFRSLEGIYDNLPFISSERTRAHLEAGRKSAFLSKQLVTLLHTLSIQLSLSEIHCHAEQATGNQELYDFCQRMEFNTLSQRINQKMKTFSLGSLGRSPAESQSTHSREYFLVNTREALDTFLAEIQIAPEFSFDTETTGLNIISDRPIGISFSFSPEKGFYLPLWEPHLEDLTPTEILTAVKPFFLHPGKVKVAHNFKFDQQMLRNVGIEITPPWGDTMLIDFLLDPSRQSFSLDALSKEFLDIRKIPTTALMGPKKETPMTEVDLDRLYEYACEDADCTLQLYRKRHPKLFEMNLIKLYHEVELPIAGILGRMEQAGIRVDSDILQKISLHLHERRKSLEGEIHELSGEEFNIASPKQLSKILFEKLEIQKKLGVTRLRKTTQGFSTDSTALEELSEDPLIQKILEYRTVTKLASTYVDQLPTMIHPQTGRIHTNFHQTGTATGRLSSSNPNLQNIPIRGALGKEIRTAFVAEPGHILLSADYSQIELRILAHLSQDQALIHSFQEGKDIHTVTASRVWDKPEGEVTSEERSQAKAINYGILYGMGPKKLSKITQMSMDSAKKFIAKYFEAFPTIQAYIDHSIAQAKALGYTETILGRRRPIPGIQGDMGPMAEASARSMAVNSPIQGSAADLIKLAMIRIEREIETHKLKARMLLQVHDELIFECPTEEVSLLREIIQTGMERALSLDVPLDATIGSGKNWLEAH